jgi:uncharacterized membrane protein
MSPSAVERMVARVLLWGGLVSVSVMLLGLAIYAVQGQSRGREALRVVQSRQDGRPVGVFTSLTEIRRGLDQRPPDALAITAVGLLCLLGTPVAGVVVAIISFQRHRDLRYTLISAIVLAMLLVSLLLAGGV